MDLWLPQAQQIDLSATHGYGPFQQPFLGVIVHVNQSNGDLANYVQNSSDVCPNFQVYKDGSIEQYLPINNQPWCQTAGNQQYAAVETEGYNTESWTGPQLDSVALILAMYHAQMNLTMALAEQPGDNGVGWHGMGGIAWGNHPGCPGDQRKAQRADAIAIASGVTPSGGGTLIGGLLMALSDAEQADVYRILQNLANPGLAGQPGRMAPGELTIEQQCDAAIVGRSVDVNASEARRIAGELVTGVIPAAAAAVGEKSIAKQVAGLTLSDAQLATLADYLVAKLPAATGLTKQDIHDVLVSTIKVGP